MDRSRNHVIQTLLAIILIGPALALGAVHPATLAIFLVIASALMFYVATGKRIGDVALDLPGVIFLGLIAYTAFQLIPLPSAIVELISPLAYDVRARALVPMGGTPPSFIPLTLDSTFTVVELAKLMLYASVYWTCLVWTRKNGSKYVLTIVIAAGVAAAAVLLFHKILILDKAYGFYTPSHKSFGTERSTAPLINENHMAALLGLCSAVAIGRALRARDRSKRILLVALAGIVGASLFLTMSRGGIAAFICGQLIFVLLRVVHRLRKGKDETTPFHLAWLPVGLAVSLGLALFVAQDALLGEFADGNNQKLELISEGLPLIGKFFATGVGRGAFWVGLPLVSDIGSKTTFTHAENTVIQILADYGIIFGTAALLASLAVIVRLLKNPPSRSDHAAILAALIAFGLHNLVDFNMEIPGVAVLVVALLGVIMGNRRRSKNKKSKPSRKIPTSILAGFAIATVILSAVIGFYFASRTVSEEELSYRQALANRDPAPYSRGKITDVLNRHPSSWYFPFIIGVWNYHVADENPMPWFARAIELNSASAPAHFYAGRTFLKVGKMDQALLEFRIASMLNKSLARSAANMLVSKTPRFAELSQIAVSTDEKLFLWGKLARTLSATGHEKEAEAADTAILELDPLEPTSLASHARRLLKQDKTEEAFQLADTLSKIQKFEPSGAQIKAEIHQRLGQHEQAVAVLEKATTKTPKHKQLLVSLAWAKQRTGDLKGAVEVAARIRSMSAGIKNQASATVLEANLELASGKTQSGLAHLRKAHALDPSNTSILLKIANVAERTSDKPRLIEALKKLIAIDPTNTAVMERLSKLEREDIRRTLIVE